MAVKKATRSKYTLVGTSSADTLIVAEYRFKKVTVSAGNGNDKIENHGYQTSIFAGNDNDSIYNCGEYTTVNAGAGNDTIMSYDAEWGSIYAGTGNDLISLSGIGSNYDRNVSIGYTNGDGNDTIYGLDANDFIDISGGSWSSVKSGNNIILTVGSGKIFLMGVGNKSINVAHSQKVTKAKSKITGYNQNDIIYNQGYDRVTVDSGAGNDSIDSYGNYSSINAGTGNNSINNYGGYYSTINAGDGSDSISNSGFHATINGGNGNDYILNSDSW